MFVWLIISLLSIVAVWPVCVEWWQAQDVKVARLVDNALRDE
jgi:hypothetical protein